MQYARYPAILTTHIRLLEKRSLSVSSVERSLSVYISDLYSSAIALVESATCCPEWELACALSMTPSLEALVRGDLSKLEDGEETEYDPFAEGEEDDGAPCIAFAGHSH
jgi:hypothetical protein